MGYAFMTHAAWLACAASHSLVSANPVLSMIRTAPFFACARPWHHICAVWDPAKTLTDSDRAIYADLPGIGPSRMASVLHFFSVTTIPKDIHFYFPFPDEYPSMATSGITQCYQGFFSIATWKHAHCFRKVKVGNPCYKDPIL